jgi:hypothetical protein
MVTGGGGGGVLSPLLYIHISLRANYDYIRNLNYKQKEKEK